MVFERRIRFMRRSISILLSSTVMLWVILVDRRNGASLAASTVTLRALTMVTKRPVIYTFQETQTPDDPDQVEYWLSAWRNAGWDARVLYLDHALDHRDFDALERALSDIMPFGHRKEKMGYYRWLAMAAVNGGWLADLTVFPLWPISQIGPDFFELSDFTVHCGTAIKPTNCLLSGSASEWERLSLELVESIHRYQARVFRRTSKEGYDATIPVWSDNYALEEIVTFANPNGRPLAVHESHVLSTPAALELKNLPGLSPKQCSVLVEKVAVRFAKTPNMPVSDDIGSSDVASWLAKFKNDCVRRLFISDLIPQEEQPTRSSQLQNSTQAE